MPEQNPKKECPPFSAALLRWLEQTYPDKLPLTVLDPGALGVRIGQQNVISKLRYELERQNPLQSGI